ncbi:MAG TPA: hypothetical protein VKY59_16705 [Spirillospora sp.]|nr:hypothetical protein [Spirillospora sp.]
MCLPRPGRWLRWLMLAYGVAVFIWLSVEDVSTWPVAVFGWSLALLTGILITLDKLGGRKLAARRAPVLLGVAGLAVGLGSSVAVTVLMFFKNARHGHLFPDYPPGMMLAMLERAPAWAAAGGLIGLGLGLGWLALRGEHDE